MTRRGCVVLAVVLCLLLTVVPSRGDPLDASWRAALLKAIQAKENQYDPAERMLRRPFSSPGYHTTLKGGMVHPTRESLQYAAALLDTGDASLIRRGHDILRRVIALQDKDPASRTYGIWSWFLEEPLEKMSPPDWNWADFCGTALLQVSLHHRDSLPEDLRMQVDDAIRHAALSIQRRNVGPGYTNIAIMGTYVTMVAAQQYDIPGLGQYATDRLRRFYDFTMQQGAFSEYNSPTYTVVALNMLARLRADVKDPDARKLIEPLYRMAWEEIATHFHVPTRQWAGPHSRCYSTLLNGSVLELIQRGTDGRVDFGRPADAIDLESHRIVAPCPADLEPYFVRLDAPRTVVKTFIRGQQPVLGTTYLHPQYAISSVNRGSFWNQQRAILAYWGTAQNPGYLHVRVLHDGYDFAAAQVCSAQRENRVLAGIAIALDAGDSHPSLDRIRNATIKARDLRLRFEINDPATLDAAGLKLSLHVPVAKFDGKDAVRTGHDVILYSGQIREIRLDSLAETCVGIGIQIGQGGNGVPPTATIRDGRLNLEWSGLHVAVPSRCVKSSDIGRLSSAHADPE